MEAFYFFITTLLFYIVVRAGLGLIDILLKKLSDEWQTILSRVRWPVYGVIIVFSLRIFIHLPFFPTDLRIDSVFNLIRFALIVALIWLGAQTFTMCLFSLYFYKIRGVSVPQILPWIVNKFLYIAAFIGYLHIAYEFSLGDLIVTTAIILIVVSIAFQKPLGNFITDVSASFQESFRYGDLIQISGFQGEVIESSWRYLRLLNSNNHHVTIPIRQTLELPLTNFSRPDTSRRVELRMAVNDQLSPNTIHAILTHTLLESDDVLETPPPLIYQEDAQNGYFYYTLVFSIQDYKDVDKVSTEIRSIAWYKLCREGLIFPFGSDSEAERNARTEVSAEQSTYVANIMKNMDIFSVLPSTKLNELAKLTRLEMYGRGEKLCKQGDPGDSLFIIVEGVIGVWVQFENGQSTEVARRSAVNVIGEMGLLTGEARTATLTVVTEAVICEISKEDIAPLLQEQPEIAEHLSEILTERKLETELAKESVQSREEVKQALYKQFLNKIQGFFGLRKT